MRPRSTILLSSVLYVLACGPADSDQKSPALVTLSSSDRLKLEVLDNNISSTKVTALVDNVVSETLSGVDKDGLVRIRYTGEVQAYLGTTNATTISYVAYVEQNEAPPAGRVEGLRIVSLCVDAQGSLYLPDVGFDLPIGGELKKEFMQMASRTRTFNETDETVCDD